MRTYRQKEALKRTLLAVLGTLLFHLLLAGFVFWMENRRSTLELYSGPVKITLGSPEGQDVPRPEEPVEQETIPEEPVETAQPEETAPPEPVEQTDPLEESRPVEQTEKSSEVPSEQQPVEQSESSDNSQITEETAEEPAVVPVVGETYGNTHELHLESAGGKAGRNLWIPIYLYMPVPQTLEFSILENAVGDPGLGISAADDIAIVKQYYKKTGAELRLKNPVPLDQRPDIWIVLERMGYNIENADYKIYNILNDVEIHFTVSPVGDSSNVKLTESEIVKSSGIPQIDEAVLYGFRQSAYYNDSDRELKGRFVYRFR